jgi:8-oxo-dGTP pyrophosphatase MutT (NUDIX family)
MSDSGKLFRLGDAMRVLADEGLQRSDHEPYHHERYERLRRLAAEVFALADERDADEIEQTVFSMLTHASPMTGGEAAIIDERGRIRLIQRADDRLWAMPGGLFNMEETAAEGAAREAREELGVVVDVQELIGVYDSRLCGSLTQLQLYHFVFLCREVARVPAATPEEVLDSEWFAENELPPLSPGHVVRVPDVFKYLRERRAIFDKPDIAP